MPLHPRQVAAVYPRYRIAANRLFSDTLDAQSVFAVSLGGKLITLGGNWITLNE